MKLAVLGVLVPLVLGSVAWSSVFLYWHFKIRNALRTLDLRGGSIPNPTQEQMKAALELRDAGCRAIPYLISAMTPENQKAYCTWIFSHIQSLMPSGAVSPRSLRDREFLWQNTIDPDDSPEAQRGKLQRVQDWWRAEGGHHHQWWRVWSDECPRED